MNEFLFSILPHPSKKISDSISRDTSIINLTVGEPEYNPPDQLFDALKSLVQERKANLTFNRYTDSRGTASLRHAIAERYRRIYGLHLNPDTQILVTHGAAEAIWLSIFTLTNQGDEILIPDPCYMLYEPIAISLNRCPVHLSTSEKRHFILDVNQIRDHLTQKARLLILNSPENPTGAVYNNSTLTDILLLAQEHGFYVMHDEVFDCHVYNGVHIPALSIFPDSEQIVMVNSFSKRFGMTGWRLGWFISAPDIITQATKAHTYISLATGTLIQEVAAQILNDKEVDRFVYENALTLSKRRHHFMNELLSIEGFTCLSGPPAGGFYFFMDIKELYRKISPSHNKTESISEEVARYLLQNCKIAVVPGTAFGPSGEGYVRISFAGSENHLKEAVCRLNRIVP